MNTKENLEHINNAVAEVSSFINNNYIPSDTNSEDIAMKLRGYLNIIIANAESMQSTVMSMSVADSADETLKLRVTELETDLAIKTVQYDNLDTTYKQALETIKRLESNVSESDIDSTQILDLDLDKETTGDVIQELNFEEDTDTNDAKDYTLDLINKLKYELSDAKLELLKVNKEIRDITEEDIKLKGLVNDYKIQLAALKSQTDLELLSNKILGFVELVNGKITSTNSSLEALNTNLEKTNSNSEESINIIKSQTKNIADVCIEIKELKGESSRLVSDLDKQNSVITDIKSSVSESEDKVKLLADELDTTKKLTDDISVDLKDTKQDINKRLGFLDKIKRLMGND